MIDNYTTLCQTKNINIDVEVPKLLKQIVSDASGQAIKFKHDIDLLFADKKWAKSII
ncbi:MAG: hypothetical protein LBD98_00455 [Endomicrobium sp.]|nr:hypothetical protein [Endomicrobium sp.]